MTGELTLLVLRLIFLAVMWIFVFSIIYALRSDLFGSRSRDYQRALEQSRQVGQAHSEQPQAAAVTVDARPTSQPAAPPAQSAAVSGEFTKIVITSGPRRGSEIPLGEGPLLIGRSPMPSSRIQDDYTSTRHARLLKWQDNWMVQDLDSTNGTYVDDERVSQPHQLHRGTVVRIGTTTFELR